MIYPRYHPSFLSGGPQDTFVKLGSGVIFAGARRVCSHLGPICIGPPDSLCGRFPLLVSVVADTD